MQIQGVRTNLLSLGYHCTLGLALKRRRPSREEIREEPWRVLDLVFVALDIVAVACLPAAGITTPVFHAVLCCNEPASTGPDVIWVARLALAGNAFVRVL